MASPVQKRDVIIAIDLGTTYSGFAFYFIKGSDENIFVYQKWGTGTLNKTPTVLLLKENGEFYRFGRAAVKTYSKLAANKTDTDGKKLLYFDKFKLLLHSEKNLNENTEVKAKNGKIWPALDVFAKCLGYLKEVSTDAVNGRYLKSKTDNPNADVRYKDSHIQWVITIPAIWSLSAKEFMRKAAYKAGIASPEDPDQLILALEPEAASYYCRQLKMEDFIENEGKEVVVRKIDEEKVPYMVVDNGGGTLDVTVHEFNAVDGQILEKHCPTGGLFGGIHVDKKFERLMCKAFGEGFIKRFQNECPYDWQVIMNHFETQKKEEIIVNTNEICIELTYKFMTYCENEFGKNEDAINELIARSCEEVSVSSGFLTITMKTLEKLHSKIVTKIANHINDLLAKDNLRDVKTLFLVGGFSECQFLRREISCRFGNEKRILIPHSPELAIMYGAVEFAQNPDLLRARVMSRTYGIATTVPFDPEEHPLSTKVVYNHKAYCPKIFSALVRKNERIDIDETRSYMFNPLFPDQTEVSFNFYSTSQMDAKLVTDTDVRSENVEVPLASPDTTKGCDRKWSLDIKFGGAELKLEIADVESGNVVKASLRHVSNKVLHSRFC